MNSCNEIDKVMYEQGYNHGLQDAAYTVFHAMRCAWNLINEEIDCLDIEEYMARAEEMFDSIAEKFDIEYDGVS